MPATQEKSSERAFAVTRVFDAPRDLVWRMWTDPDHIAQWWGPNGFRNTIFEMDVRPGGVWRFVMHGPDGTDYQNKFVYVDVVEPERIVYDHVTGPLFRATATFAEQDGKTSVTVEMMFETAELRDRVEKEFGAVEGLKQTLVRLGDRLAAATKESMVLTREFDAPRDMVFKAWTDPKQLARWWGPKYFTNPVCELDVRRGGAIKVDMKGPDGTVYPMGGTFHEIDAPKRLIFTSTAFDGALEVFNTVTFVERNGKTTVTVNAVVMKSTPEVAGALAGMREGWTQSLDKLAYDFASDGAFVISRQFDAPRDLVWDAWTKCEHLEKWFGPKGTKVTTCKLDFRVGGTLLYALREPDGSEMWGKWTFREIEKPKRLVLLSSFSNAKGDVTRHPMAPDWPQQTLSTTDFEERDGKTIVTIHWSPYNATEVEKTMFENNHQSMQGGWGGTFEQLESYLKETQS